MPLFFVVSMLVFLDIAPDRYFVLSSCRCCMAASEQYRAESFQSYKVVEVL
jgi:hypothetical protein